jgi:uncharacterized protein YndB with AHSA1/START domain
VQMLAGRGLASATIAIDPAPFQGVLPLPLSSLKSAWPVLGKPAGEKDHTVPWAIANASFKVQARNPGVTEIVEIPNRGHRSPSTAAGKRSPRRRSRSSSASCKPTEAKEKNVSESGDVSRPDMTIVRVFDAPRPVVWSAWIEPQQLAQWFGPEGFTIPVCEADARPGCRLRITMQSPDGTLYPMDAVFDEVIEPERLVWTTHVEHGADVSFDIRQVTTFAEHGDGTEVTTQAFVLRSTAGSADALGGMEQGWSESLDKLEEKLARN